MVLHGQGLSPWDAFLPTSALRVFTNITQVKYDYYPNEGYFNIENPPFQTDIQHKTPFVSPCRLTHGQGPGTSFSRCTRYPMSAFKLTISSYRSPSSGKLFSFRNFWVLLISSLRCLPINDFVAINFSQIDHMIFLSAKTMMYSYSQRAAHREPDSRTIRCNRLLGLFCFGCLPLSTFKQLKIKKCICGPWPRH